ncbi:PREDICTED: neuropeptide FF receptor 2-like [Priapulus caudatus]|uniref:Neuropeptide FF receptor 2-like n=1 Tax=Priapulus caudatus TaxID=37621 RepID=A0ABM1EXN2_PRICU|nr:PREDICTED: neuropeptide FF receptor 2-like [Priapulus caudatus]
MARSQFVMAMLKIRQRACSVISSSSGRSTTLKKRHLFRPNLFIIGHVAVTDLATAVICLPLVQAATAVGRWPFSASACAASAALNTLLVTASVLCIIAVSVERYFSIVRPY